MQLPVGRRAPEGTHHAGLADSAHIDPQLLAVFWHGLAATLALSSCSLHRLSTVALSLVLGIVILLFYIYPADNLAKHKALKQLGQLLVPVGWLIISILAIDDQVRLLAGVFLVQSPGMQGWGIGACLLMWMGTVAAVAGPHSSLARCAWGPVLLYVSGIASGSFRGIPAVSLLRAAGLALSHELASQSSGTLAPDTSVAPASDRKRWTRKELKRIARGFPNWKPVNPTQLRLWTEAFQMCEDLLAVYVCTVPAGLRHPGHLYLSTDHVSFHGTAAVTHVLQFVIALIDIEEVRYGGCHDVANVVLKHEMHLTGHKRPVHVIELHGCEDGAFALAELVARHRGEGGPLCEYDDGYVDYTVSQVQQGEVTPMRSRLSSSSSLTPSHGGSSASLLDDASPFQPILKVHVPLLQLEPLAMELLAEEWPEGSLVQNLYQRQGCTEVQVHPWLDELSNAATPRTNEEVRIREVTLVAVPPPRPMCPTSTRMTVTFRVKTTSADNACNLLVLELSSMAHDVPFGENFAVQERIQLTQLSDGVHMEKYFRIVWIKSVGLLGSVIRSQAALCQVETGNLFVSLLQGLSTRPGVRIRQVSHDQADPQSPRPYEVTVKRKSGAMKDGPTTTCTVHIWELQRRPTLFHTSWIGFFLPHDGQKRWRWVDTSYQKHPWTRCQEQAQAAAMDTPPIAPESGWEPEVDWSICTGTADGTGDQDGWQYAFDFYLDDWWWNPVNSAHHVRRRLWTRKFKKID